jgi:hypothetical protein
MTFFSSDELYPAANRAVTMAPAEVPIGIKKIT